MNKSFQTYIDSLNETDLWNLVTNNSDNYNISEARSIIERSYPDNIKYYIVSFTYTIIKKVNKVFSKDYAETAITSIVDEIPFRTEKDANFYLKYAKCPSIINEKEVTNSKYYWRKTIFLKNDAEIKIATGMTFEAAYKKHDLEIVFGLYGTGNHDSSYLEKSYISVLNRYKYNIIGSEKTIVTLDVHSIASINDEELEKIRQDVSKSKNERTAILLAEIERSNNYIKFLKSLL